MDDLIERVKLALEEILEEATGDMQWEIVLTAASDALDDIERAQEDPLPF